VCQYYPISLEVTVEDSGKSQTGDIVFLTLASTAVFRSSTISCTSQGTQPASGMTTNHGEIFL
jgi:hypothetical protein